MTPRSPQSAPVRGLWWAVWAAAAASVLALGGAASAQEQRPAPDERPSEDARLGGDDDGDGSGDGDGGRPDEDALFGGGGGGGRPDEDALFGGGAGSGSPSGDDPRGFRPGALEPGRSGADREDALFGGGYDDSGRGFEVVDDALTLGGQLYLRFNADLTEGVPFGEQRLAMPNLLDVYLDARPEDRVRAFVSGRVAFDPTVAADATDFLGNPRPSTQVLLDQMWIKTDIARAVFLTVGAQRIRWGATRLWNPTDVVNRNRIDPIAFFDIRTGVPMLKVHVPIESIGWNIYALALLDEAALFQEVGGALRLEMVFGTAELSLSALAGTSRKTVFGADISAGVGPFDVAAEVSVTDEHGTTRYSKGALWVDGDDGLERRDAVTTSRRAEWVVRASAGIEYGFAVGDDDTMYLGLEYSFDPAGVTDPSLYPAMAQNGDFVPLYTGQHYAGLLWLYPSPGSFDEGSLVLSALANLSDGSVLANFNFSAVLHTRLTLEAFIRVAGDLSGDGTGEFYLVQELDDLPNQDLLESAGGALPAAIRAPRASFGLNLRVAL